MEVRDGILQHKSSGKPMTLEGVAVSLADRIAYINHDIEDAIRAGVIKNEDLPQEPVKILGKRTSERIHTTLTDIYKNSYGKNQVKMSKEVENASWELRAFMFERVYHLTNVSMMERAERMLTQMFEYFMKHPEKLPAPYDKFLETFGKERAVCDYISGMTDRYAISVFEDIFLPQTFSLGGVNV